MSLSEHILGHELFGNIFTMVEMSAIQRRINKFGRKIIRITDTNRYKLYYSHARVQYSQIEKLLNKMIVRLQEENESKKEELEIAEHLMFKLLEHIKELEMYRNPPECILNKNIYKKRTRRKNRYTIMRPIDLSIIIVVTPLDSEFEDMAKNLKSKSKFTPNKVKILLRSLHNFA